MPVEGENSPSRTKTVVGHPCKKWIAGLDSVLIVPVALMRLRPASQFKYIAMLANTIAVIHSSFIVLNRHTVRDHRTGTSCHPIKIRMQVRFVCIKLLSCDVNSNLKCNDCRTRALFVDIILQVRSTQRYLFPHCLVS